MVDHREYATWRTADRVARDRLVFSVCVCIGESRDQEKSVGFRAQSKKYKTFVVFTHCFSEAQRVVTRKKFSVVRSREASPCGHEKSWFLPRGWSARSTTQTAHNLQTIPQSETRREITVTRTDDQ